jgi:threonine dehydratase
VHPYNDLDVIAGQGTVGIEIHEQGQLAFDDLAAVFVAVGGGCLISGIGTAIRTFHPQADVVGCWAANSTPLYSSLQAGKIIQVDESETVADGVTGNVEPDSVTFDIARRVITATHLADEAMKRVFALPCALSRKPTARWWKARPALRSLPCSPMRRVIKANRWSL